MAIQVGDKLPEAKFRVMTAEGPQVKTTDDIFNGKKVALFALPGAYTGTCHKMHLPSIFLNAYAIKDKGVDTIAIVSVNDAFVMNAWKRDTDQRDEAVFLADRVAVLRQAFMAAFADPELLAEAAKIKLDIEALSGAEVQALVAKAFALPPRITERAKQALIYKPPS